MTRIVQVAVFAGLGLGLGALLAGCASTGGPGGAEDRPMACKACYDQVVVVRTEHAKGAAWSRDQVIRKHNCAGCEGNMEVYTSDGRLMVKCPKCAPKGIPCDKCLPPGRS